MKIVTKLVILYINDKEGDFHEGFPVSLRIREKNRFLGQKIDAFLPPNPDVIKNYKVWQSRYLNLVSSLHSSRRVTPRNATNVSIPDIIAACEELKSSMNNWLNSWEFLPIIYKLEEKLSSSDNILFIFNTKCPDLQRLPWYFWEFFDHYTKAELALSFPVRQQKLVIPKDRVKILAVFGNNQTLGTETRIAIDKDWELLKQHLIGAEFLTPVHEPTLEHLNDLLWEKRPDIFYYGGHSSIAEDGRTTTINIRHDEKIEINDLIQALKRAGEGGLQLAIFNSCEGLEIARQLADSSISHVIVMREAVPDEVARRFLEYFLREFAQGKPLYLAVREARQRMGYLDKKFPGASWLPMIFQNPAELPYSWQQIQGISIVKEFNQTTQADKELINDWSKEEKDITEMENLPDCSSQQFSVDEKITDGVSSVENLKPSQHNISGVWTAGQRLGKYVIDQVLGQGGFGITYKALHVELNRHVVIKTPNQYLRHDPEYDKYIDQFIQEGRTLARLSQDPHPHIVGVIDLFKEGTIHCLVMDFVPGENLFEAVKRRGALPEAEIIPCIRQIGEALVVVHQAGLVHRDTHPGNIMLRTNGKAVLIDFGIAKELVPKTLSSKGIAGNEGFAPYEQMSRGSREPTVDVYCLAATLYYAVTGQRPTTSLARKLDNTFLIPPKQINPSISDKLNQAILKGMALEAKDRPQTMQEWLVLLGTSRK